MTVPPLRLSLAGAAGAALPVLPGAGRVLGRELVTSFAVRLARILRGHRVASQRVVAGDAGRKVLNLDALAVDARPARARDGVAQMVQLGHVGTVHPEPGVLVGSHETASVGVPEGAVAVVVQPCGVEQATTLGTLGLLSPADLVRNAVSRHG